jgi:hypothetical protein
MVRSGRREFLADVGKGMLLAGIGSALAQDLGLAPAAWAADDEQAGRLTFGDLDPLVDLMQQTPADRLLPEVVERIKNGAELRSLVAAAALANARTFGGQDYDGYHAFMALLPSYQMAAELPEARRALPVLKVLYRNSAHIQESGGGRRELLHPVEPVPAIEAISEAEALRTATRTRHMDSAERRFAAILHDRPLDEAYNDLQWLVQDNVNVHRVVLAWRAWALLDLTGKEHAHTMLRQSVRYCVAEEHNLARYKSADTLRLLLPRLLDEFRLLSKPVGDTHLDDAALDRLATAVYASPRDRAARAVAGALADGVAPADVGEAIALAANRLVLCDPGRKQADTDAKPVGSVHGASVGVHASDAANAWRNIARVSNPRNAVASLVVAGYHTGGQAVGLEPHPHPLDRDLEKIQSLDPDALLPEAESAIRAGDQRRACALVARYGTLDLPSRPAFDLLLRFAISEDGALHAEKYYRTVTEEFSASRPPFRHRHLAALARVTASEYGHPAPGVEEAKRLLNV